MSKPYESSVRNQLYQLAIFVELPRLELGTEACKATVFANYTIAPFRADTQTRTEISGLEDQSTNHCAIPAIGGHLILFHMIFTQVFGHL